MGCKYFSEKSFISHLQVLYLLLRREETQGDLFLNLASSAGLPADFPLDAADFANFHGTADKLDKIFSKICSAASALRKIILEICQNCRNLMVFLSKCCGGRFKYACWIMKEMVKVPGGFLSNDSKHRTNFYPYCA